MMHAMDDREEINAMLKVLEKFSHAIEEISNHGKRYLNALAPHINAVYNRATAETDSTE